MTRAQTIEGLAKMFAARDGYAWQLHPVGKQTQKQIAYRHLARSAVAYVETAIKEATGNEWEQTDKTLNLPRVGFSLDKSA